MLELTPIRRRTPLAEAPQQQALHRRHLRLRRGLSETTFVTPVPDYIQTYLGETTFVTPVPPYIQTYLGARMYDDQGNALEARMYDERGRALEGFGALDSSVSTTELQRLLRKIGHCETGSVDGLWGPRTNQALANFVTADSGVPRRFVMHVDWQAAARARTVRIDAELLARLRTRAAGQIERCGSGGGSGGGSGSGSGGSGPPMTPLPDAGSGSDYGIDAGSIFRSPWLWLGLAAVAGVGYYAYTKMDQDEMMMSPPRL